VVGCSTLYVFAESELDSRHCARKDELFRWTSIFDFHNRVETTNWICRTVEQIESSNATSQFAIKIHVGCIDHIASRTMDVTASVPSLIVSSIEWEWQSMMPGITYLPVPSITRAFADARRFFPTPAILPRESERPRFPSCLCNGQHGCVLNQCLGWIGGCL
jgi:hypothetical protein